MRLVLPFVSESFERLQRHFIGHKKKEHREYKLRTDKAPDSQHIFHNWTWCWGGAHKLERLNIDVSTSSELDYLKRGENEELGSNYTIFCKRKGEKQRSRETLHPRSQCDDSLYSTL